MKSPHTGLYFGTFNPVHVGHMIIAQYMLEYSDLEQIWFVVTPQNPFKQKESLLNDRQRLYMVELAIKDPIRMRPSDEEFGLPQPSYTITTLTHLGEKYPDRRFSLIMGADNLRNFHKWKNHERIIEQHDLYIYPRKGEKEGVYFDHLRVHHVDAPVLDLSATLIRRAISEGKDVSYMLPPKVWEYISVNGFYL